MKAMTCRRCGGGFECGAQDGHCDCFEIRLSEAQRAALAQQYDDCLCLRCLRELAAPAVAAQAPPPVTG
jgi:hypothetical protein